MNRLLISLTLGTLMATASVASAQDRLRAGRLAVRAIPASIQGLKLAQPATMSGAGHAALQSARVNAGIPNGVIIRLNSPSVAEQKVRGKSAQRAKKNLQAEQTDLLNEVMALDPNARVLGQTQLVLNAVFVEVDASVLATLASNPAVLRIVPVANYEMDLSETVPYIGASAVQADGFDGSGVSVAVLDSGIDYNHAALGGSGIVADYDNNDPNIIEPGTFPTAKVVGGFDFVGSVWPTGDLAPDPDPLDDGAQSGHGTHVGHIIGGVGGVAPGADLYAVKVCSSVSTSCSGVALINAMEFAVDPDGDGDPSDAVDLINMSLGSPYGQAFDDDLSAAVDGATAFGVLTVASAGNSSDKPYILGSPSAAPTALAVAQTQVPSAELQFITVDAVNYPGVFQPWSGLLVATIGPVDVLFGGDFGSSNGCSTNPDPDAGESEAPADRPYSAGTFSGEIVLVDRGSCSFTAKIRNVEFGGGSVGIIGLVAPGDPFSGAFGGGTAPTIPGYMISQADSSEIKVQIGGPGGIGTVDPSNGLPLVGQMVGSSSRGPSVQFNALAKPEIGAPGASVSAIAGTGTGTGPFGGTSGAAPMVTGSAALVLHENPSLSPAEIRAVLVNTGETQIYTDPFSDLAPIARIGGGEVRVDRAVASSAAAWDSSAPHSPVLSFGLVDAVANASLTKTVTVTNYGPDPIDYSVASSFRYAADDTGAVTITPSVSALNVPANSSTSFDVTVDITAPMLKTWYGNSGPLGADPNWITDLEYDGYVDLDADGADNDIHLPWHVLPRKASNVAVTDAGPGKFTLTNNGAATARIEAFNLIATSADLPEGSRGENMPITDFKEIGYRTIKVPPGFCGPTASYVMEFAVTSWEPQTHANIPNAWDLYLDFDGDGIPDANIWNFELAGDLSDGRNLTFGNDSAWFYTDHETNSGATILTVCAEQIGLKAGKTNAVRVAFGGAFDLYFQGDYTDFFGDVSAGGPGNDKAPVRYKGNNSGTAILPPGARMTGTTTDQPALLLFRDGAPVANESATVD